MILNAAGDFNDEDNSGGGGNFQEFSNDFIFHVSCTVINNFKRVIVN